MDLISNNLRESGIHTHTHARAVALLAHDMHAQKVFESFVVDKNGRFIEPFLSSPKTWRRVGEKSSRLSFLRLF
jgi:hypothetical protein